MYLKRLKLISLLQLLIVFCCFNRAYAYSCGGSDGAKHLNPGDELGKPTGGFVASTAKVDAQVFLGANVEVCDRAIVSTLGSDTPRIEDKVKVYGRAKISGNVTIKDQVEIFGGAKLEASGINHILVREKAKIYGYAKLSNNARVQGNAIIAGAVKIEANGRVCKDHKLERAEYVFNRFDFCPIPIAVINIDDESNLFGPELTINANAEVLGQNSLSMTYIWDFGDFDFSRPQTSVDADHFYRETGDYLVTLKVYDQNGEYDTEELLITIREPLNKPPYASIKQDFYSTTKNSLHVKFDASQSVDEDGYVVSYEWDFGNGQTSEEINPEMTFLGPGIYFPKLKVTDDQGSTHTSESVVEVNCTIDEGDNTCPYFVGYTDHILPMSNHRLQIAFGQNGFTIPETTENMTLTLTNDLSGVEHDAVSALEVDNGRLYLNTDKVRTLLTDFNNSYTMNIKLYSAEGDFYSGMLNSIHFAGSTIKGTTPARAGTLILVEHVELGFSVRTKVRSDKTFEMNDLPFGQYNVTLIDGPISTFESFLLPSLATANLYLYPVDETVGRSTLNTISINNNLINDKFDSSGTQLSQYLANQKTSFPQLTAEKILFTPDQTGTSKDNYEELIPENSKKIFLAYQVYAFSKQRKDTFAIRLTGENGFSKIVNVSFAKLIKNNPNSDLGGKFLSSDWITETYDLKDITGKVKVDLIATNTGKEKLSLTNDCETGIGINLSFKKSNAYIDSKNIKRVDDNGKDKLQFFPTSVAPIESKEVAVSATNTFKKIKNPFNNFKDRGWFLEFSVPVVVPSGHKVKDIFVSLSANVGINSKNQDLFAVSQEAPTSRADRLYNVRDISTVANSEYSIVTKKVQIPISSLEKKIWWLKFDPDTKLNNVKFEFKPVVNDGTKDVLEKDMGSIDLIPLFNGIDNPYIKCGKYSSAALISMYGTYETLSSIKKITDDPLFNRTQEEYCKSNRRNYGNRLYCNDISLPFGGLFVGYHKGENHKTGTGLDILYPSCNPLEKINRNPDERKKTYDKAYSKKSGDLEFDSIEKWTNGVREGLDKIGALLNTSLMSFFATYGSTEIIDWQSSLLREGVLQKTNNPLKAVSIKTTSFEAVSSKMLDVEKHFDHVHLNLGERK